MIMIVINDICMHMIRESSGPAAVVALLITSGTTVLNCLCFAQGHY